MPFIKMTDKDGRNFLVPITEIQLLKELFALDNGKKVQAKCCQVWLRSLPYAVDMEESFDSLSERVIEAGKASQP